MKSDIKIMIVEDEFITANGTKRSLENMGYIVSSIVATGEKAVKKAEEDMPDLVLMDIELHGEMDGVEVANVMRLRFDIPCIYVTAYSCEKIIERAKPTEPFGYIIKPFGKRELRSNIEMALYKHQVEKKLKKTNQELQDSLAKVKLLSGLLPICANCKDIRNDRGYYEQIEKYIVEHSEALFSHGICPKCVKKFYPDVYDENLIKEG